MRKILLSVFMTVALAANITVSAFAATEPDVIDELKDANVPDVYLVQLENYLNTHQLTDEQSAAVEAELDYILDLMEKEQIEDISQLSLESRGKILKSLKETALKAGFMPVIHKNFAESCLIALKDAGVHETYLVQLENYLNTHQLTDGQLAAVINKIDYFLDLMMKENITDISELSPEYQNQVLGILKEGAEKTDLSAVADENSLKEFLAALKDSGLPDIYLIKLQNYFKTHHITQLQLNIIIIKYNYVDDIMEKEKTKDVSKLSPEGKSEVIKTVKEAAQEADLTVVVNKNAAGREVIVLKDTQSNVVLEETAYEGKMKRTGNDKYVVLLGTVMIILAGISLVFIKRKEQCSCLEDIV